MHNVRNAEPSEIGRHTLKHCGTCLHACNPARHLSTLSPSLSISARIVSPRVLSDFSLNFHHRGLRAAVTCVCRHAQYVAFSMIHCTTRMILTARKKGGKTNLVFGNEEYMKYPILRSLESRDIAANSTPKKFFPRDSRRTFIVRAFCGCATRGWKTRVESATTGINNFISGAQHYSGGKGERGASLFLRDLDRKNDSCAIAHDFLRVPAFSSISSACLYSHPRLSFPRQVLRRFRFSPSSFFHSTDSILAVVARTHFQSSDFCRHRVASAYRFRCAGTPESIRSPPFNITRPPPPPASFLSVASGCAPACAFEPRMENASPYQSLPLDCTAVGSRELSSEDSDDQNGSKINKFFPFCSLL